MCTIQQYLNNKDKFFIVQVAEKIGYSSEKITFILSDDMSNFRKYENELRIRICDEINCKNVFDEGFLTEESNVFFQRSAVIIVSKILKMKISGKVFYIQIGTKKHLYLDNIIVSLINLLNRSLGFYYGKAWKLYIHN